MTESLHVTIPTHLSEKIGRTNPYPNKSEWVEEILTKGFESDEIIEKVGKISQKSTQVSDLHNEETKSIYNSFKIGKGYIEPVCLLALERVRKKVIYAKKT